MKFLWILLCAGAALSHYIYGNNGYQNNNYGNNEGNVYTPAVPYVLPLTFLRKVSSEAAMQFKKIGQDSSMSVRDVEEQRLIWSKKHGVEKEYEEFAKTGQDGVKTFFNSVKKLISMLDHFFTKSKNIERNHEKSYKNMQKAVKELLSGLSYEQQMVVGVIINVYGINFFPFLNDAWCNKCIEDGGYSDGNSGYPGNNGGYPGNNGGYPGNKGVYPGNGGGYPGGGYTSNNGGYPGSNGGYPYGNGGYPGGQVGFPGANGGFQGPNGGFPGHNGGYSGNNGAFPGGSGWFPGPRDAARSPTKKSENDFDNANPVDGNGDFHKK
ncbi:hypothetical protein Y032_0016g2943 [Ancylostoma ceylanicum]|uniref:SXP/RAL-2 family protein Ani s 5-like cation-binding domain-containing protein n=2 Tax=Ancylostoma ceylanicum TaxID=53326 RepID=A0A016V6Y6_9BILA|nr:hypothetical protein Y032_0016g2943 [Ancylostoma ceylanicum]